MPPKLEVDHVSEKLSTLELGIDLLRFNRNCRVAVSVENSDTREVVPFFIQSVLYEPILDQIGLPLELKGLRGQARRRQRQDEFVEVNIVKECSAYVCQSTSTSCPCETVNLRVGNTSFSSLMMRAKLLSSFSSLR